MRKTVSIIMSVALLITIIPVQAFAVTRSIAIDALHFPDDGFRNTLLKIYDDDENGYLSGAELNRDYLRLCSDGIKCLDGIEYFENLQSLDCMENYKLASIDLSKNKKLTSAKLSRNNISELILGDIPDLDTLYVDDNNLTSLDVSKYPKMRDLRCDNNHLTKLDISKNPELDYLSCTDNDIKTLNISNNSKIDCVYAQCNNIMHIEKSKEINPELRHCYYMPKTFEMPVRENMSMDLLPSLQEERNSCAGYALSGEDLIIDDSANTISLAEGKDEGTLIIKEFSYSSGTRHKLYFRYPIKDVTINGLVKINDSTYKTRETSKEIKIEPVVRDENNNILEKDKDYTIKLDKDKIVEPGDYTLTIEGQGKYKGEITKNIIVTPKVVQNAKIRLGAYNTDGYNDAYITWNKSKGADGYMIYMRRPNVTTKWTLSKTVNGNTSSYLKKNLYSGYRYQVKVIPFVKFNNVNYRTIDGYRTLNLTTLKKTTQPKVVKYKGAAKVSWGKVDGRTGYQIAVTRRGKTEYFTTINTYKSFTLKNVKTSYKVRPYKTVTKNGKPFKVYAPWSAVRTYTLG